MTRFSVHHFPDPGAVLREMVRVLGPKGTLVVVDMVVSDDPAAATAFNAMELLRDPSHVACLTRGQLQAVVAEAAGTRATGSPVSAPTKIKDQVL